MEAIEVSASIGTLIVHAAAARGVVQAELVAAAGFAPVGTGPDARIPLAVETRLWDEAARRTGDEVFGLHAAAGLRPGSFDVVDYAVRTAPTLRAALDRLARYNRLLHDAAVFTVHDRDAVTRVEHGLRVAGAVQSGHAADFTMASIVVIGRQLSGRPLRALAVELAHPAPSPAAIAEHVALFGVAPRFATVRNAIELDRTELERPMPTSDPVLSAILERHADALLAARPEPAETMSQRVRRTLATALGQSEGDATLPAVASRLGTSERSLQRHLADEGTSFDGLLDELRHELALRYVADRRLAIAEVAYLLGYSEPSAFHRAFRRWTGATPTEVRRQVA